MPLAFLVLIAYKITGQRAMSSGIRELGVHTLALDAYTPSLDAPAALAQLLDTVVSVHSGDAATSASWIPERSVTFPVRCPVGNGSST